MLQLGTVHLVLACIYSPICLVGLVWFWLRRNLQPIKARTPWLPMLQGVIFMLYFPALASRYFLEYQYPCYVEAIAGIAFFMAVSFIYLLRMWLLHVQHYSTTHLIAHGTDTSVVLPACVRYPMLRNVRLLSGMMFAIWCLLVLPVCIASLITMTSTQYPCANSFVYDIFAGYVVLLIILVLSLGYTLLAVEDNYHLRREFSYVGHCDLVCLIGWFLFTQVDPLIQIDANVFSFSALSLYISLVGMFTSSIVLPIYWSYQDVQQDTPSAAQVKSLGALLKNKVAHDSFCTFLQSEYALENLYFYKEIESYHDFCADILVAGTRTEVAAGKSLRQILRRASHIYHSYIRPGEANYEINIQGDVLQKIQDSLSNLKVSLEYKISAEDMQRIAAAMEAEKVAEQAELEKNDSKSDPTQGIELEASVSQTNLLPVKPVVIFQADQPEREDSDSFVVGSMHKSFKPSESRGSLAILSNLAQVTKTQSIKVEKSEASKIFNNTSAPLNSVSAETLEKLQNSVTVFDAAQREIFDLMARDSYTRFARSDVGKNLRGELQRNAVMSGDIDLFI